MSTIVAINTQNVKFARSVNYEKSADYALHCHNIYEVYYFISGEVSYLVEGKRYVPTPHSILMLPINVFHGVKVESEKPYERYSLHFSEEILPIENRYLLLSPFHPKGEHLDIYYQNTEAFHMLDFFENVARCIKMPEDIREPAVHIAIQSLLSQLVYMSRCTKNSTPDEYVGQIIPELMQYLNRNLTENISLDQISAQFFISKHYLNKLFRKATGTTVMEYMIHKRVIMAQQLILQGQSAAQAAANTGFGDYSVFYRAYIRVLGHAPAEDKSGKKQMH